MPRGKRLNVAGAIYHIISRGIERRRIYDDEEDREEFLKRQKRKWQEVDEVLSRFGKTKNKAKAGYRKFIEEGINLGRREELTGGGLRRSAGGWSGVSALKEMKEYWRGDERILGDGDFVREVLMVAEERMRKAEEVKSQGQDIEWLTKEKGFRIF